MRTILCLHASASGGRQWRSLQQALGSHYRVLMPDLIGYGAKEYVKSRRFSLDDEVDHILRQVGDLQGPVDVLGHSYGGGVALRLAQRFPERVNSLTLYEPAQPLALFEDGLHTPAAREMRALREVFQQHARSTFFGWRAAREAVAYWSGKNAWSALQLRQKRRLARLTPKVAAEWDAMFSARASLGNARDLTMPVNLIVGSNTRNPAATVCALLRQRLPNAVLAEIKGATHLAPISQPQLVNPVFKSCLEACRPVTISKNDALLRTGS